MSEDAIAQPTHDPVGAGLARDKNSSVNLQHRSVCTAGKPGFHRKKRSPFKATLAHDGLLQRTLSRRQPITLWELGLPAIRTTRSTCNTAASASRASPAPTGESNRLPSNATPRRLTAEDAVAQTAHNSVGAGLARDKSDPVHLQHRGACIAGKPGSHRESYLLSKQCCAPQ